MTKVSIYWGRKAFRFSGFHSKLEASKWVGIVFLSVVYAIFKIWSVLISVMPLSYGLEGLSWNAPNHWTSNNCHSSRSLKILECVSYALMHINPTRVFRILRFPVNWVSLPWCSQYGGLTECSAEYLDNQTPLNYTLTNNRKFTEL